MKRVTPWGLLPGVHRARLLALSGSRHSKVDGAPYCPMGSKPKIRMGAIPLEPRKRCA